MRKTAVLMSGGVDSSVAALLLRDRGYEVLGLTIEIDQSNCPVERAQSMARILGLEHHALALSDFFQEAVIEPFLEAYRAGRTPNPCFRCNPRLKFGKCFEIAREMGAEWIATGHYARILPTDRGMRIAKGLDSSKDQSYFLAGVPAAMLENILFPNGELTKEQVREIAREHNLPVADSEESQEICFTPGGDVHASWKGDWRGERGISWTVRARCWAVTGELCITLWASGKDWDWLGGRIMFGHWMRRRIRCLSAGMRNCLRGEFMRLRQTSTLLLQRERADKPKSGLATPPLPVRLSGQPKRRLPWNSRNRSGASHPARRLSFMMETSFSQVA